MSETQVIFDVTELRIVGFTCQKCGTTLLIGVSGEGLPDECPTCQASLDELASTVNSYRNFYKKAKKLNVTLRTDPSPAS